MTINRAIEILTTNRKPDYSPQELECKNAEQSS